MDFSDHLNWKFVYDLIYLIHFYRYLTLSCSLIYHISATLGSEETQTASVIFTCLFLVIHACLHTQQDCNTTEDFFFFFCFVLHCCWLTGQLVRWEKTPSAPDGSLAPAAKVAMLHNHSLLFN